MRAKFIYETLNEIRISKDDEIRYAGHFVPTQYRGKYETRQEKKIREARELIQNNKAYLGTFKSVNALINSSLPQNNDWVLRSADGEGSLLLFDGDLMSKEEINNMKTYYKIDQNLHYFQGRPITYERWKELSDDLKFASRRKKY